MHQSYRNNAERHHCLLSNGELTSEAFRLALLGIPPRDRDAWLDLVLGLDDFFAEDGPELPLGCVPYLPCSVEALLRMVEYAQVRASDVFVDVGSGVGRAALLVHLLTGAAAIGLEIQSPLVRASRAFVERVNVSRVSVINGDASALAGFMMIGSIFFLYCPFSGERLEKLLDTLEPIARTREIRICGVDLPLPKRPWLSLVSPPNGDLLVYRSTLCR